MNDNGKIDVPLTEILANIDEIKKHEPQEAEQREYAIIKVPRVCIPKGSRLIEAYETDREIIIMGDPPDDESLPEDKQHNCDAMGCGYSHVLFRFTKPQQPQAKKTCNRSP